MTERKNQESGNVFIYIIGAIFLLGVLIALMKGSFSPGAGIDQETLILRVTKVREQSAEIERAVATIIQNGHSENEIRFAHPNISSVYGDIDADTPSSRQVFHVSGGGAEYLTPSTDIQSTSSEWVFTAANEVDGVGSTCAGNGCADLLAILPNVTQGFCIAVNDAVGVTNPSSIPPRDAGTATLTSLYSGTITYVSTILDAGNHLKYKSEGCFEGGGTPANGTYHYYKVLLAR